MKFFRRQEASGRGKGKQAPFIPASAACPRSGVDGGQQSAIIPRMPYLLDDSVLFRAAKAVVFTAAVVFLFGGTSSAAGYELGGGLGYAVPVSGKAWTSSETGNKSNLTAGLHWDYRFGEAYSAGVEAGYNFAVGGDRRDPGANSEVSMVFLGGRAKARIADLDAASKKGRVYALFGAGIYRCSYGAFNYQGLTLPAYTGYRPGFSLGAGYELEAWRDISAGLEVRYQLVSRMLQNVEGKKESAGSVSTSLTAAYRFH